MLADLAFDDVWALPERDMLLFGFYADQSATQVLTRAVTLRVAKH